ncbi:MAG TPA: DNA-processing protein DprA, partial [Thermoanaerobaculia bacterium]|nr:DNA-processing protein DprA [Thermoanaerobaculia bacterium]
RVDPSYPTALLHLDLPPPVLYRRGRLLDHPRLAVVGSRAATRYGIEAAGTLSCEIAASGVSVVSGMARGIDAAAHQGALAAVTGRTIGILGCGIDVPYPRGHRALAARVAERGALLSEFGLGVEPRPWHFPVRNRLIAALSAGTLVVEAAARSGSLITARLALELGREVFAVPGRIFDRKSIGPNTLIRDGAVPVQQPRDVLEALLPGRRQASEKVAVAAEDGNRPPVPAGPAGKIVAAIPADETVAAEELAAKVGLSIDRLLSELLELELGGWVRREPGPAFRRGGV